MKRKMPVLIALAAVMVAAILGACAPMKAAQQLDRIEDKVENRLDQAEEAVKGAVHDAIAAQTSSPGMLTAEEAKTIAVEHADLTVQQVSRLRAEYEIDDGIPQYDVEFHYDGYEYNYEIHAETGKILSFEKDR